MKSSPLLNITETSDSLRKGITDRGKAFQELRFKLDESIAIVSDGDDFDGCRQQYSQLMRNEQSTKKKRRAYRNTPYKHIKTHESSK